MLKTMVTREKRENAVVEACLMALVNARYGDWDIHRSATHTLMSLQPV